MSAEEIAHALGGRRSGQSFLCRCPAHQDRTPSLSITEGDRAPLLKCFAGCSNRDIIDALRRLGLWDAAPSPSRSYSAPPRRIARRDDAAERQQRIEASRRIWAASKGPRGTLAEQYLNSRGLELPDDLCGRALRFHPACPWGDGQTVPALVAAFQPINEPDDEALPAAILRIGLNDDASKIAKRMLGPVADCAVKLDADENAPPRRRQPGPSPRELELLRGQQWASFVDARIDAALARHDAVRREATGQALGEIRAQLRNEIKEAIGQLRAEMTLQRAHDGWGNDKGEVIDLPLLPRRKRP